MKIKTILLKSLFFIFLTIPSFAQDTPFYANDSYTSSRTKLFKKVYIDHRQTLYCNIPFDENKNIIFPKGFDVSKISSRAKRIEIEHVVPAEEFGAYMIYGYGYARAGMSGGGTFDAKGNFVGMISGGTAESETASVPLICIEEAYAEICP